MASETEQNERLKRLQMADLGTARREYISATDDRKNISFVRIEELEAARQSNIPGTAEYKQALKDSAPINMWRNLHNEINDTSNADSQLSDLMHGQSHRAHLNDMMRFEGHHHRFGSQRQVLPKPFPRALPKASPMPPPSIPYKTVPRGPKSPPIRLASGAHEAGILGTRGRGFLSPPRAPAQRTIPTGKKDQIRPSTRSSSSSQESKKSRRKGFPNYAKITHKRSARPHQEMSFSGTMASPQQFLAQVQARMAHSKLSLAKSIHAPAEENTSDLPLQNTERKKQAQVEAAFDKPKNTITPPASAVVPETPTPAPRKLSGQKSFSVKDGILVQPAEAIKTSPLSLKPSKLPDKPEFSSGSTDSQKDGSKSGKVPTTRDTMTGVLLDIENSLDAPDVSENPLSSPGIAQLSGLNFYTQADDRPSQKENETTLTELVQVEDTLKGLLTDPKISAEGLKLDPDQWQRLLWQKVTSCQELMEKAATRILSQQQSHASMQSSKSNVPKMDPVAASPQIPKETPSTSSQPAPNETINQPSNLTVSTSSQQLTDSFSKYRSPPRTPSSQDSKEDVASEISPPTPSRNRVLKAAPALTERNIKDLSSSKEPKLPAIPQQENAISNPDVTANEIPSTSPSKASSAVEIEGTSKALAESMHARKPSTEISSNIDHSRVPSEKPGPKVFGPPQFVKRDFSKKSAVAVSVDSNESQSAAPKQAQTAGPASWRGFKSKSSNVPGPAVKQKGSESHPRASCIHQVTPRKIPKPLHRFRRCHESSDRSHTKV
ncbi:hypothetical protein N7493_010877 [Penicillium malachiteum]|uniref:Uncharacterized protein n=1 Tax=Penicillium malachiteum TaxID=1324776 RepID=A0AAD6HB62_9EURO|nr:hypothetical protein N7493_010877 [Penicillium malachiteum]